MVIVNALILNSRNPDPLSADNSLRSYAALCGTQPLSA